jgi:simple sugar transport system permease protein
MRAGANRMQFDAGVSSEIVDVILALVLFFVAADMIVRWLLRIRTGDDEKVMLSSGWGSK